MFSPPRKPIRLPPDEYLGTAYSFITICCRHRQPFFKDPRRGHSAVEALKHVASSTHFATHAFCLMPDHVHFLLEGVSPSADLMTFVGRWKQQTGYVLRNDLPKGFWQRRFHDHILRCDENPESVAWYIWMNPVRKGLVSQPQDYPFSGPFPAQPTNVSEPSTPWLPPWKKSTQTSHDPA